MKPAHEVNLLAKETAYSEKSSYSTYSRQQAIKGRKLAE